MFTELALLMTDMRRQWNNYHYIYRYSTTITYTYYKYQYMGYLIKIYSQSIAVPGFGF